MPHEAVCHVGKTVLQHADFLLALVGLLSNKETGEAGELEVSFNAVCIGVVIANEIIERVYFQPAATGYRFENHFVESGIVRVPKKSHQVCIQPVARTVLVGYFFKVDS